MNGGRMQWRGRVIGLGLAGMALVVSGCGDVQPVVEASRPPLTPVPSEPSVTGGATPAPTPTPTCSPEGIALSSGNGDAAMGLRVIGVELLNCGTENYRLNGYPELRLLDAEGKPIKVEVLHGDGGISRVDSMNKPAHLVVLKPGERASAGILWRNLVTDANVVATLATSIEVTPIPAAPARAVAVHIDLGNTGRLGVSAWAKIPEPQHGRRPETTPVPDVPHTPQDSWA